MAEKKQFFEKILDWIDNLFKQVEQEKNYIPKFEIGGFLDEKGVMRNAVGGKGLVKIPAKVTRIANAYSDDAYNEKFRSAVEKSRYITGLELPVGLREIDTLNISWLQNLEDIYVPDLAAFCKCRLHGAVFNQHAYLHHYKKLYVNGQWTKDLVIPDGVETIQGWQFFGFYITSVTISSMVKTIEENAFNACVEKFVFEENEINLPSNFFEKFPNLKEVVILSDELDFSASMFKRCGELEAITYPNRLEKKRLLIDPEKDFKVENGELVKYLGYAKKLTIPSTVEKIASAAFAGNEYLEEIVIPDCVKTIGEKCFENCRNLRIVQLPSTLTAVEDCTFARCKELKMMHIPDNVTTIGENVFKGCKSLQEIDLGKGIKEIGKEAFCECEKLEAITLPESVVEIGDETFIGCKKLQKIVIEGDVKKIGRAAFDNLKTDLYFLGSVKRIEEWNLPDNRVHIRDISVWTQAEVFYEKPKKKLVCEAVHAEYKNSSWQLFCNGKEVKEVILPEGVVSIPAGNFYGCQSIETVRFQGNVKSIGAFAFCGCVSLEFVEFPGSLKEIGECAFMGCRLREIALPEGITVIKRGTFENCSLAFVELPSSLTSIEAYAFTNNKSLSNVRIPEKLRKSGNYAVLAFDDACRCN